MWLNELKIRLKKLNVLFKEEVFLAPYTTIKIGGSCTIMVFPEEEEKLIDILKLLEEKEIPFFILGGGSKLLVSDEGFEGVVINFCNFKKIKITSENEKKIFLNVSAGTRINEIIGLGMKIGFGGLEFLGGVPATLGGTIKMNASAFENSISQFVKHIKLYKNGKAEIIKAKEELWEYRKFKEEGIILSAELGLPKMKKEEIIASLKKCLERRKKTQPIFEKTFGSVFKNPPSSYAGFLIEACSLKGYQIGDAKISEKHANFIVNMGNAKATEVLQLIKISQEKVFLKFGINLEPEVNFLGCSL